MTIFLQKKKKSKVVRVLILSFMKLFTYVWLGDAIHAKKTRCFLCDFIFRCVQIMPNQAKTYFRT